MNSIAPNPSTSQVKNPLTKNQRAVIDRLMDEYPTITPESVRTQYEHYYFSRNWFVCIEHRPDAYHNLFMITRCDHQDTAGIKARAIASYIASKQGGLS
jgi:hypothetical protein